jgi:hypothetical protein
MMVRRGTVCVHAGAAKRLGFRRPPIRVRWTAPQFLAVGALRLLQPEVPGQPTQVCAILAQLARGGRQIIRVPRQSFADEPPFESGHGATKTAAKFIGPGFACHRGLMLTLALVGQIELEVKAKVLRAQRKNTWTLAMACQRSHCTAAYQMFELADIAGPAIRKQRGLAGCYAREDADGRLSLNATTIDTSNSS